MGGLIAERRLAERLLAANAVWPGSGQPLADPRPGEARALRRMIASGVIRDDGHDRYYLYAPAYLALRHHRRQRLLLALIFVALAVGLTALAARLS